MADMTDMTPAPTPAPGTGAPAWSLTALETLPAQAAAGSGGAVEALSELTSLVDEPTRPIIELVAAARAGAPERPLARAVIRLNPRQTKWVTLKAPLAALAVDGELRPADERLVVRLSGADGDGAQPAADGELPEPLVAALAITGDAVPAAASQPIPESVTCEGRPVLGVDENLCDPAEH